MIHCQRFVSLITDAREGAISEADRASFEEHGALCGPCRCYLEGIDHTVELLHEAPAEPAPEGVRAAVLAMVRARRGG